MKNPKISLVVRCLITLVVTTGLTLEFYKDIFCVEARPTGKILTIRQGDIKGKLSLTREGRIFVEYFGIPYAKEPKRFQKAGPAPKWKGIRDGSKKGSPCYHFDAALVSMMGSEDCLYLNVHTPSTHLNYHLNKLAVVIAIHGGQFVSHSGDMLGAKYFMDHDIVFVSFNYRLGIFGFFSTSDEAVPANLGLKDQVMALQWVQTNIHFFGGDPKKVTLMGYNSGAAFVSYHMVSPMSKGLFHRGISQSGNLLCPWAFVDNIDDPMAINDRLASKAGCEDVEDSKALVTCLSSKTAMELEAARLSLSDMFEDPLNPFGPVVEHWMRGKPSKSVFLRNYPYNLWMDDRNTSNTTTTTEMSVPWLTGVNSMDGLDRRAVDFLKDPMEELNETFDVFSPIYLNFGQSVGSNTSSIVEKIRKFYFQSKNITINERLQVVDALTDRNYLQCTKNAAIQHAKRADVFLYYFEYVGEYSLVDDLRSRKVCDIQGAMHSDELQYLFDLDELGDYPLIRRRFRKKSLKFSRNLVKLWVNFIKTGKPKKDWQRVPKNVNPSELKWYKLGLNKWGVGDENFTKRLDFWDSLHIEGKKELPAFNPELKIVRRRTPLTTPVPFVDTSFDDEFSNIAYIDGDGDDDGTGGVLKSLTEASSEEEGQGGTQKSIGKNLYTTKKSNTSNFYNPTKHPASSKASNVTNQPSKSTKQPESSKSTKTKTNKTLILTGTTLNPFEPVKNPETPKPKRQVGRSMVLQDKLSKKKKPKVKVALGESDEDIEMLLQEDDTLENELNHGFDETSQEISTSSTSSFQTSSTSYTTASTSSTMMILSSSTSPEEPEPDHVNMEDEDDPYYD